MASSKKKAAGAGRSAKAARPQSPKGAARSRPKAAAGKKPAAPAKAAPKKPAPRKAASKKAAPKKAAAKKTVGRAPAAPAGRRRRALRAGEEHAPLAVPGLSEEDQIREAKYLPRELGGRRFEEERFLFPESYGVNRIRLLVRDPEWIFAYWDVDPASIESLGRSLGERALALSRLTLRVVDPVSGGLSDILLPQGARWWYVRTDAARRTYRAELGVTLATGEFRRLAESNTVVTPRVGPSPERARRRMSYRDAGELPASAARAAAEADNEAGVAREPWEAESHDGEAAGGRGARGGASDSFRPGGPGGASDVFRPGGASDTFRR